MTIADVALLVNVAIRLWVAVSLTQVGWQNKMRNLLWLAVLFYSNGVFNLAALSSLNVPFSLLGIRVIPLAIPFAFRIGALINQIALVMFLHQTFYQGGSSPFKYFLGMTLGLGIVGVLGTILEMNAPGLLVYDGFVYAGLLLPSLVNWSWHVVAAYRGYAAIAADSYVEDWIKSRYVLMIASALFAVLAALSTRFVDVIGPSALVLAAATAILTSVLQFLVWVMPERYRRWLNRNYTAPSVARDFADLSEDELLRQLRGLTPKVLTPVVRIT
jgi:hypothetical protein